MKRFAKRSLLLLSLAGTSLTFTQCTHVKPWEKETLADYTMRPDRDPADLALTEHLYFSREAASGGRSVGGGGCGCN